MREDKASITQLSRVFDLSRSALHDARSRASLPAQPLPYSSQMRARRLMRQHQLHSCWGKRYRVCTTDSRHGLPVAANVLDRQFDPPAPNQAWGCDITYIPSDAGWLYLAVVIELYSRKDQITPSMSRKGNCWDNAPTERFLLSLKTERVWRNRYANLQEARRDTADYIVNFYNSQRLHSSLDYCSPNDFEHKHRCRQQQTKSSTLLTP